MLRNQPPLDPVFRHPVTTAPARLATLTTETRKMLAANSDGYSVAAVASTLRCTEAEALDAMQALGRAAVCYLPTKGWRVRLRSAREQMLVARNDNVPYR